MNKGGIQQRMGQQMGANAFMQLSAHILQASTIELQQIIQQAMESNPTLEELEPQYAPSDNDWEETRSSHGANEHHDFIMASLSSAPSLQEHLKKEVSQSGLSEELASALSCLIDSLNPRGFFDENPDIIAEEENIRPNTLKQALAILHDLEPAGIGACNVQESLLIQLAQRGESHSLPAQIIQQNWDDIISHNYEKIAFAHHTSLTNISEAINIISHLSPSPGIQYSSIPDIHIEPDLLIWIAEDGELDISLTQYNIPALTLNATYKELLAESAAKPEIRKYLSQHFREARELIGAIEQRQETLLSVGKEIMRRQKEFFLHGEKHLKPMRMEDVANELQLHTSTISRSVSQKYVRSPQGIQELRNFFQISIPQKSGVSLSPQYIQMAIENLISKENPSIPLSDEALCLALAQEGIQIARRTISKYRDKLHILPAQQRRR